MIFAAFKHTFKSKFCPIVLYNHKEMHANRKYWLKFEIDFFFFQSKIFIFASCLQEYNNILFIIAVVYCGM